MAGSTLGTIFRITTWGESHGAGVGVVIDGCPAGLPLTNQDIQEYLDRRKPGQSRFTFRMDFPISTSTGQPRYSAILARFSEVMREVGFFRHLLNWLAVIPVSLAARYAVIPFCFINANILSEYSIKIGFSS